MSTAMRALAPHSIPWNFHMAYVLDYVIFTAGPARIARRLTAGQGRVQIVALLIGLTLAIAVGLLARTTGLDRDRAFYTTVMMVIALLYVLFAVMGESMHALALESLIGAVFLTVAVVGFKSSLWAVAVALAAHGIYDLTHSQFFDNPGVPSWWPAFCSTYDITAAAILAWLIQTGRVRAKLASA